MGQRDGFHEDLARVEAEKRSSDRTFGVVFAIFFVLVAGMMIYLGNASWGVWAMASIAFLIVSFAVPRLLSPLNRLWFGLGLMLAKVMQPVIMALLFFGTVVPTGLILRAMGKDVLKLRRDPNLPSYWIARASPDSESNSMKNQF